MMATSFDLPPNNRFQGRLIAVSVSAADDLDRLGFAPDQMDRVLQAILTPLVSEGARVAYGGRIEQEHNYTLIISDELGESYRRQDQHPGERPFVHFIAQHRFLATDKELLLTHLQRLAPYGEVWAMGRGGVQAIVACIDERSKKAVIRNPQRGTTPDEYVDDSDALSRSALYQKIAAQGAPDKSESYTEMRREMARRCDGRIVVGGRTTGFSGIMSGVTEEALTTVQAGNPLVVLGGFGGASRDIAIALGLMEESEAVPNTVEMADRQRYQDGLSQLRALRTDFQDRIGPNVALARQLAQSDSLSEATEVLMRLLWRLMQR